jgi:hypothetical protein
VLSSLRLPPWTREQARAWWELWREDRARADATGAG